MTYEADLFQKKCHRPWHYLPHPESKVATIVQRFIAQMALGHHATP